MSSVASFHATNESPQSMLDRLITDIGKAIPVLTAVCFLMITTPHAGNAQTTTPAPEQDTQATTRAAPPPPVADPRSTSPGNQDSLAAPSFNLRPSTALGQDPAQSLAQETTPEQDAALRAALDRTYPVQLNARLTQGGAALPHGLVWYVFELDGEGGAVDEEALVAKSAGGSAELMLKPGSYVVHASYGKAVATTPLRVAPSLEPANPTELNVVFDAGGLRLRASVIDGITLAADTVSFTVYTQNSGNNDDRVLVVEDARDGHTIPLPAGTYHIVSTYGELNAKVRADIRVEAGQLTDAVMYHKAAEVTLKLVNDPGGEALANTQWLVLTPGGDTVKETVGAFPTLILAEGEYSVIARHDGRIFNRDFVVESGLNREIEVVAR